MYDVTVLENVSKEYFLQITGWADSVGIARFPFGTREHPKLMLLGGPWGEI